MDRVYQANAIETPPSTTASSGSYPTAGNKASGQLATVPGPYWFYSVTEEIRNAIVAAGISPDPAKVDQLATAFANFLPLSGGTMTGDIKFSGSRNLMGTADTESTQIYGGTAWDAGSFIGVYGKFHASRPGWIYFSAHDGANAYALIGKPDGSLTWGDSNLVRSVNGVEADADGNVPVNASKSFSGLTSKGKINSGTCTYDTIVIAYSNAGSVKDLTIDGTNVGSERHYHDEYHTVMVFPVPAGKTWSIGNWGNGSNGGIWYMEIK